MRFKLWLEAFANSTIDQTSNQFFARKATNADLGFNSILTALKLPTSNKKPQIIGNGSTATVYRNPHNPNQVIKVTGDMRDARNFSRIKGLNIENVAHCYNVVKINPTAAAILCDYIQGTPMVYSNDEFLALVNGDRFEDYPSAIKNLQNGNLGKIRTRVFYNHKISPETELPRLIPLFKTLFMLEQKGIDLVDFDQNVIFNGQKYVIIDLGQ